MASLPSLVCGPSTIFRSRKAGGVFSGHHPDLASALTSAILTVLPLSST
jgi:hypothetical protein